MTSEQLKAWRASKRLSQSELAAKLGLSRDAVSQYERGINPLPRTVALACGLLDLGVEEFSGEHIKIHQYRVFSEFGEEWIENPLRGWKSKVYPKNTIVEWFAQQGLPLDENGVITLVKESAAAIIRMKWF